MTDNANTQVQMIISVMQDPCDERMIIYKDDVSGFYCLTKAVDQIKKIDPNTHNKRVSDWTQSEATAELKKAIRTKFAINKIDFAINGGDNHDISGIYVHPYLYRDFLSWLSNSYAIKMFATAERAQREYENATTVKHKDNKIIKTVVDTNAKIQASPLTGEESDFDSD